MKPQNRKFLEDELDGLRTTPPPSTTTNLTLSPDPLLHPINNSSSSTSTRPLKPNSPFDSSIALTVLFTALFFMGFFSIYIRRFADNDNNSSRRRRSRLSTSDGPPRLYSSSFSLSSSSLPMWRPSSIKGLDPTTVRSLPLISYGGDGKHPIDCVICLNEFEEREAVKLIPNCRHVFHPKCIDTWLESHLSCPLCRSCQIFGVEEVRLGASRVEIDCDVTEEDQGESTVESGEARDEEGRREVGIRRTCSWPSLGDRVGLQRSLSF